uniref:Cadherin domain-containing protein n=1 Tax=Acanthochromis polyacanthus TaxID=80966 RepID=A0A3Q1EPG6_9TELE
MEYGGFSKLGLVTRFAVCLLALQSVYAEVSYSFQEEMKPGTVIGNIAKDLGVDMNTLSARKARIDSEGNNERFCAVNVNTGDLSVAEKLDRESLCGTKPSCILVQELVLENPLELHRINLHIQDINDNSPQFKRDLIRLEISESAEKGTRFLIEEAHDADIGKNSVQTYNLQKNDHFNLIIDSNKVELVLENKLDRETKQEINLLLTAVDGASPQKSGTVMIHVTVLDANDNAPVFNQGEYKANVPENSPVDTVVHTVSATDADEGVNGDVTYEFGHVSETDEKVFSIGGKTGEIRVIGSTDFEKKSSFELRVIAKDGLGLSSYAKVYIDLTDENDNAPIIYLKSLTNPIPENVSPGTEVGIINVQDRDSEKNRQVRCSIQQGVPFKLVPSIKKYYSLVSTGHLDREVVSDYNITISATDEGSPPLSSSKIIHVTVLDANDNAPVFSQTVYKASLPENSPLDTVVVTVSATDADEGVNGDVTYEFDHISDESNNAFSLDQASGEVRVSGSLDYEELSIYEMQITAKDGLGLVSSCTLIIDITDVNDNAPITSIKSLTNPIPENTPPGTEVGIINVQDRDSENNGKVRCYIHTYNYDAYLTTGSRTSDFKFVTSYNDNTLPADQTLRKSPSDFVDAFGDCDSSPEVGTAATYSLLFYYHHFIYFFCSLIMVCSIDFTYASDQSEDSFVGAPPLWSHNSGLTTVLVPALVVVVLLLLQMELTNLSHSLFISTFGRLDGPVIYFLALAGQ